MKNQRLTTYDQQQKVQGFTLIELLVAMTLFSLFMTLTVGVFVRGLRTERAIASFIEINNNASLALEQMVREMRVGSNFSKISADEVQFVNSQGQTVAYRRAGDSLERGQADEVGSVIYGKITADSVRIERFNVVLFGGQPDNQYPARVTIAIAVGSKNPYLEGIATNVQTTISSRAE